MTMTFETIQEKQGILEKLSAENNARIHWNLKPAELVEHCILRGEGRLCSNGALAADTGKFTGRSPKDRFIVADEITEDVVWWGDINIKFDATKFDLLFDKVLNYLSYKELYIRDGYACALPEYRTDIRIITESAFQNLFFNNLFIRPEIDELESFEPEWHIISAPTFEADSQIDGTRQGNFSIINFTRKMILIGGTAYTGEIKKGIFSVLNFLLPHRQNVLSMHCSANVGENNDTAIFFGLSGTGKTTLSSDPKRKLIGDDEHGWTDDQVFNFEGGCYAKAINLSAKAEPQIYNAIKFGTLLENICFYPHTRIPDYSNDSKTENTRAAYPIDYIDNALKKSFAQGPENIFLLTADAFGVLPPISKLSKAQAMYYFISGYTAKVAGTEAGVKEPQPAFSACFGQVFLPLHPTKYAEMLGQKLEDNPNIHVWLVNTGWTSGPYGVGKRMNLSYTRAMVDAALEGKLDAIKYITDSVFGLQIPISCPGVPAEVLIPRDTWKDKAAYDKKAKELAAFFSRNFEKYADYANDEIKSAAPIRIEG